MLTAMISQPIKKSLSLRPYSFSNTNLQNHKFISNVCALKTANAGITFKGNIAMAKSALIYTDTTGKSFIKYCKKLSK